MNGSSASTGTGGGSSAPQGPEKIQRENAGEVINLLSRDTFSRLMECQICQEIPLPPIYICTNGHNICSYCHSRIKKCGLCSAKFPNTRNLTVENIINSCTFACMYESEGCRDVIKGEDMKAHITNCSSKPPPEFEALTTKHGGNNNNDSSMDDDSDDDDELRFLGAAGNDGLSILNRIVGIFDNRSDSSATSSTSSISTSSGNTTGDSSNLFTRRTPRRSISLSRLFRSPRSPTPPRPRPTGPDGNLEPRPAQIIGTNNSSSLRVEVRDLFNNNGRFVGAISSTSTAPASTNNRRNLATSSSSSSSSSSSEEESSMNIQVNINPMPRNRNAIILSRVGPRVGRVIRRGNHVGRSGPVTNERVAGEISNNIPTSTRARPTPSTRNVTITGRQIPFPFSSLLSRPSSSSRNNNITPAAPAATSRPNTEFIPLALRTRSRSSRSNATSAVSSSSRSGRLVSSSSDADSRNEDSARSRSPIRPNSRGNNRRMITSRGRGGSNSNRRARQRLNLTPTSPFARNLISSLNSRSRVRRDLINDSDSEDF